MGGLCFFLLFILLFLFPASGQAATLLVPSQYATITAAITASIDGDVVQVSDGTYSENINYGSKNITIRSVNGALLTTIRGVSSGSNPVVTFNNAAITNSAVLDGFTIDNQRSAYGISISGGAAPTIKNCAITSNTIGIYATGAMPVPVKLMNSSVTLNIAGGGGGISLTGGADIDITDSSINNNKNASCAQTPSVAGGGGIYATGNGTTLTMTGGSLSYNDAQQGAGAWIIYGSVTAAFTGVAIYGNGNSVCAYGQQDGGGIFMGGSSGTLAVNINRCDIRGNWGLTGGGLAATRGTMTVKNSNITGNTASGVGGGAYALGGLATMLIYNSTVAGNYSGEATAGGGGLRNLNGNLTVENSIIWGNTNAVNPQISNSGGTTTVRYSDVDKAGYEAPNANNNMRQDPLFRSFTADDQAGSGAPKTTGDFHLTGPSPVINTGTDNGYTPDIDGDARVAPYDMGSDEFTAVASVGGYTADNVIPVAQISQARDGSGLITITWKGKEVESHSVILKNFEYSVDGGGAWSAPAGGDASASLSAGWSDNGGAQWSTAATFGAALAHLFTLNTKHADLSGLNGVDQADVRVRFKLNNGTIDSGWVVSDNVRVDDATPTPVIAGAVYNSSTDNLSVSGSNFTTIANAGTDIKPYVDWSKFVWDVNGDNSVTPDITTAASDVVSLVVTNDSTLTLTFTGAKGAAIEATPGYGISGGADTLDVTAGFIKDYFGNAAVTDAVSDAPLSIAPIISKVYSDEGVTPIGAGKTVRMLINGVSVGTAVTEADGIYSIGAAINPGDAVVAYIDDDATYKGATVTVANGPVGLDIYAGHVVLRHDNGGSMTSALMAAAKGAYADADMLYSVSGDDLTVSGSGMELYLPANHGFAPGGNVTAPRMENKGSFTGGSGWMTVSGDLVISGGAFTATSGVTTVGGSLALSSGSFSHNLGTVVLNGPGQSITGSFGFFNLAKTVLSADTLTFAASSTTSVEGVATLQGASGQLLSLASSISGTRWYFAAGIGATRAISYVNVRDSDASDSDPLQKPIEPGNSTNGGNNVDWFSLDSTTAKVMLVYSGNASPGTLYPKERRMSASGWSDEKYLPAVTTTSPKNVALRTRPGGSNERVAAVKDQGNQLFLYSWRGAEWTRHVSDIPLPVSSARSFDVAYEQASGRAIVVYPLSASSASLKYRIWNGFSWGAEIALSALPTTGAVVWVRLEPRSASNEIMLVWSDGLASIGAGVWDGDTSTWSIKGEALSTVLASNQYQCFDAAYETASGRAVVAYIANGEAMPQYYTYLGGTWNGPATAPSFSTTGEFLRLKGDPRAGSDRVVMGIGNDTGNWLKTALWNGAAWEATVVALSTQYSPATTGGRAFDLAWESTTGRVMAVYGNASAGSLNGQYRVWDGVTWSDANWAAQADLPAGALKPQWVQLAPDPSSGQMLVGITDLYPMDLNIHRWNGAQWMGRQEFSTNVSTTVGENFGLSYRNDSGPHVSVNDPDLGQSLSGATYTISGFASDDHGVYTVEVSIQRSDNKYWTGGQWSASQTWLRAENTTSWSYLWKLPPDYGAYTYTLSARASDNLGQTAISLPVPGVRVYNIAEGLTVDRNTAAVDSSTQITATAYFIGDGDGDSSTLFETGPSAAGPWTDRGSLTTASPRAKMISGLAAGAAYYVRITHADPDGVTGANPSVIGPYSTKTDGTTVTAILAGMDDCNQATVSAYYSNDGNGNGTTAFSYSVDASSWTPAPGCGAVSGASPRQCVVTGLTADTVYYFRATFSDADGISGTNPISTPSPSPYRTLATCLTRGTTTVALNVDASNCRQLTVMMAFTGDDDNDGSVLVEYKKSADASWSAACGGLTGASPRTCFVTGITGLDASTAYDIKATYTDPDGMTGVNPQTAMVSTPACAGADVFPPTLTVFRPMDGAVISGNASYPARVEITAYDMGGLNASSVKAIVDGVEYATTANPNVGGNFYYNWAPLTIGYHTISAKAADSAGNVGWSQPYRVYVNSVTTDGSGLFKGDGKLLVRENTSQLCFDCHGGIQTHGSQNTSAKYGNWSIDCRTCHQPHNTANIFLIRPVVKTPNSGEKAVDFRNTTGQADYSYATKTAPGNGPCEVCHTKTRNGDDSGRYRNTGTGPGPKADSHFTDQRCTDCHKHTQGFSPISAGNITCGQCHPDRWNAMNGNTNEYHMYMQNSNTTAITGGIGAGSKYPSESQPSAESEHRRCLMCHADMDVFHYKNNPNSPGVAYNLRVSINVAPDPADQSTHTNRDFDGSRADGGICFSCHQNQQTKNTAKIKNDGTTYSPGWDLEKFKAGTHNYSVPVTFKADNSTFNATCVKCHTDTMIKDYQSSTYRVGAHSGTTRSYLSNINKNATLVETTTNSLEENMCYQCHSMSVDGPDNYNPNGYNGVSGTGKDGYNVQPMAVKAQRLKYLFSKDSSHPIDGAPPYDTLNGLATAAGRHRVDEGVNDAITPSGVQVANWNPAATRHVECMDCHNPHATNVTPRNMTTWRPNSWHETTTDYGSGLGLGVMSGYQVVEGSFGGQIGGANYGTWGVNPTYTAGSGGVAPTSFTKITSMNSDNMMYQLCFKCHSLYAYGATKPQIPWGTSSSSPSNGDTWGGNTTTYFKWDPGPETDISVDFNPYNYGFHPVTRRGRNQPAPHLNTDWPFFNGGAGNQAGSNWWVTAADPATNGTVNYNAATKVVTIASGNNFPSYYMQAGWKIQFTQRRPTAPADTVNKTDWWYEVKTVDGAGQITLVSGPPANLTGVMYNVSAGLGWAFVPPYGPWSTLACGDCHQSGNIADPAGPHGSDNPWILREINHSARVDNNLDGDTTDTVDYINTSTGVAGDPTGWNTTSTICYSCHRRDVYGTGAVSEPGLPSGYVSRTTQYSRLKNGHPPGFGAAETHPAMNSFGIWCLNCHGGDAIGGIHGSNRGVELGPTPVGLRLRNGAIATGNDINAGGGACYTKNSGDSVNSCSAGHGAGGASYTGTYGYAGVD